VIASARVRDDVLGIFRRAGATRIFGNPGSTEIPFLGDLPSDFEFVLGLHEGPVVGIATGYALGTGRPAVVNLHTAAGLGNAVNAIACARDARVPLVLVIGQQDRRQLALEPFLTGRSLERLAGDYPVWSTFPASAAEVPGAIARAFHEAAVHRGPALVVVPMSDWDEVLAGDRDVVASPAELVHAPALAPGSLDGLTRMVEASRSPAIVVGAGTDSPEGWDAVVALAEKLACPVWQDTFSSRAGFPQDHPLFAGHLPWRRSELRTLFADVDLVLALGTPGLRLYIYDPGPILDADTRFAVVSEFDEEALRTPCDLAVLGRPDLACRELTKRIAQRSGANGALLRRPSAPAPPQNGEPLRAAHLVAALAERLPADAVLFEEAPSTRPETLSRIAIRSPLGFVAVANGTLGYGLAGAIGVRMALPERPVVALLGDGSSTYSVQGLWTAAHYGVGTVFVVVGNGRYAVMDELAQSDGLGAAWPPFEELDLAQVAQGLGCESERVVTHDELESALDRAFDGIRERTKPLLIDVRIAP
jgi:benzoylformate decarboxylase